MCSYCLHTAINTLFSVQYNLIYFMASLFFILARAASKRYTHYKYVFIEHKVVKFMLNKIQESVCQLPIGFFLVECTSILRS